MTLQAATSLVTGATSGIGLETARQLAGLGSRVLVHGRSQASASAAAEDVLRHGDAEPVWGDLASFAQVRELAGQVRDKTDVIDVLVNNAGVFLDERRDTVDGHETTLQVNHLSMQLLTVELLPQVCAARAARVLTVSSVAHFRGTVDFDDLEHRRDYTGMAAYQDSKLYNVLFAQELAEKLKCEAATSNVLHPGTISTKLLAAGFPSAEGASLADGATTLVYLATSPVVADITGAYFVDKRQAHASPKTRDPQVRRRLWEVSAEMVGVSTPE